jgi:RNA polymerase sigma-70 factor (ECF subfamily)
VPEDLPSRIDKLRRFAFKLCKNRDDAENLLHTTVLRALEKRHMFEAGTDLFGWTSKMMFNLFVTQYRRKAREP